MVSEKLEYNDSGSSIYRIAGKSGCKSLADETDYFNWSSEFKD